MILADWFTEDAVRRCCKGDDICSERLLVREVTGDNGCMRDGGSDAWD